MLGHPREQQALVEIDGAFQVKAQLFLGHVKQAQRQQRPRLCIHDPLVQSAP